MKHIQSVSDERVSLIELGENPSMDIDEEHPPQTPETLFLYVDCPTMMQCFYGGWLPYNSTHGALLTNLPPYQKNVSFNEVNRGLREASGFVGYEDPIRSAYFAALSFPGHVAKLDEQLRLTSTDGETLIFDLYATRRHELDRDKVVSHGECMFG
ncbi:hypothetical protein RRH01S_12_00890 [Rhizobium rhizogenes NBRC 13257]|nr:hypothetical protein RRH01S_12_00890 [Rhizobium rhizogenes NBRC 13257]